MSNSYEPPTTDFAGDFLIYKKGKKMTALFVIRPFISRHSVDLALGIWVLIVACAVGTAHAATCAKGYWLDDTGSCTECSDKYYCPGDDARHACPEQNMSTEQIKTLISQYVPLTNPDYSKMKAEVETYYFTAGRNIIAVTDCGYVVRDVIYDEAHTYAISFYYNLSTGGYTKFQRVLYRRAFAGYYVANVVNQYYSTILRKCTNAPADAYYTGPGTPDVGDCPWECDAGYGHTSDDRCLPLCRIGDTAMNGINIYAGKHTKYAMAVPRGGSVCWINATRGQGGKLVPVN